MSLKPALLPDDPIALKALVVQLHAQNAALSATVRAFEQRIAKFKRQAFDKAAQKVERKIEQLELVLEDLLIAKAEVSSSPVEEEVQVDAVSERAPLGQARVSADTPRERRELDLGTACSDCGDQLRRVGENVSAVLDRIVAQLKVVEIVRVKKPCSACDKIVDAS